MPQRKPSLIGSLAVLMAAVGVLGPVSPATAQPVPASPSAPAVQPDFDGDSHPDLVVGVGVSPARVSVRYASGTSLDLTRADLDGANSYGFGQMLLARDLNADGFTDLVIGDGDQSFSQPKALFFLFGSSTGLQVGAATTVAVPDLPNGGQMALLESPSPLLVIGGAAAAKGGAFWATALDATGRPTGQPFTISQASPGVPGADESGDRFGAALATTGSLLVVGAPGEDVGAKRDAGAVTALTYLGGTSFTGVGYNQNSTGVPGKAESGDRLGFSVAANATHVIVGVPGEDGARRDSGLVQVFRVSKDRLKAGAAVSQDSSGIPGKSETGDQFGWSVTLVHPCANVPGFAAGAPSEAIGSTGQAGAVWTIGLVKGCAPRQIYAGHPLVGSPVEMARLGSRLSAMPLSTTTDALVIAAEGVSEEGVYGEVIILQPPFADGTSLLSGLNLLEERGIVLSSPRG